MPRQNRSPVSPQEKQTFDAFALAKGSVPKAFEAPAEGPQSEESLTPERVDPPPEPKRPKATPSPHPEEPTVRRMGRRRTGRNVPFNQMVSAETANHFYDTQRELDITMGEVLERAIDALREKMERDR